MLFTTKINLNSHSEETSSEFWVKIGIKQERNSMNDYGKPYITTDVNSKPNSLIKSGPLGQSIFHIITPGNAYQTADNAGVLNGHSSMCKTWVVVCSHDPSNSSRLQPSQAHHDSNQARHKTTPAKHN